MNITGIVAEYNPFHNGHLYQLAKTKHLTDADFVIAVMSGNFTQRGTPSIVDKFMRTRMALLAGVDLVLELPVPFATASAERFCEAAVSILNKTGIVNTLSFGSELGSIELLQEIASLLINEPSFLSLRLKDYLSKGYSFPRAREHAIVDYFREKEAPVYSFESIRAAVGNPNNILGIEYIKALQKYHSSIRPITVKRKAAHYHDKTIVSSIASATAIRTHLQLKDDQIVKQCLPNTSYDLLMRAGTEFPSFDSLNHFLHYKFIFSNKQDLYSLWDVPKDLILSLHKNLNKKLPISAVINSVTSKTYTKATVQRALIRMILNILQDDMMLLQKASWIPYIRVLGCKKSATILLSELTQHAQVPVITNLGTAYANLDEKGKMLIDYEVKASNIYDFISNNSFAYNRDFTLPFLKI